MKQIYTTVKLFTFSILLFPMSAVVKAQTASHTTSTPTWTPVATIGSTSSASFTWINTSVAGVFQKGNTTTVVSPVLQYQDAAAHPVVNFSFDLQTATASSTITSYTVTVIWGSGGSAQASATGGSFNVSSGGTPVTHNFTLSGVNLPGNGTPFQVKLAMVIPGSERDINSYNFKSDAGVAGSGIVLAVQMSSFAANRSNNNVSINWTTNYESNNRGFEIQRRYSTQTDFETVAFVNTKATNGNSTTVNNYSYVDVNNSTAVSYYRIRQVNKDGSARYSLIRQVDGTKTKAQTVAYPNPAVNGTTNLVFATNDSRNIQLSDMSGHAVKTWNSYTYQELKISNLKSGVYFLQINSATGERETQRIVVTQ